MYGLIDTLLDERIIELFKFCILINVDKNSTAFNIYFINYFNEPDKRKFKQLIPLVSKATKRLYKQCY